AITLIGNVFRSKKEELAFTTFLMLLLLVLTSSLIYYFKNAIQPDKFPDIPSTMWWSVATLTTVGYGDVYPITGIGKFLASIAPILGIGFFALPTGLLGAAFVNEIEKSKSNIQTIICPHCKRPIKEIENS
ncbi:MAG: two pore domain potassium channel family protein, partial [Calditrichaeota bacterium]